MSRNNNEITFIFLIIVTFMASPMVQALSQPNTVPLIVDMNSRSIETNLTINELSREISAKIVDYKDLNFVLESLRWSPVIIYVGHGNNLGINTGEKTVRYSELVDHSLTPNILFAACHSAQAEKISSPKKIIGFEGVIDSILAANVISLLIGKSTPQLAKNENVVERTLGNIIQRVIEIQGGQNCYFLGNGILVPNPWSPGKGFTADELLIHGVTGICFLLAILAPLTAVLISYVVQMSVKTMLMLGYAVGAFSNLLVVVGTLIELFYAYQILCTIDVFTLAAGIITLSPNFFAIVIYIISFLSLIGQAGALMVAASEQTIKLVPGAIAGIVVATIVGMLIAMSNAVIDYFD